MRGDSEVRAREQVTVNSEQVREKGTGKNERDIIQQPKQYGERY